MTVLAACAGPPLWFSGLAFVGFLVVLLGLGVLWDVAHGWIVRRWLG